MKKNIWGIGLLAILVVGLLGGILYSAQTNAIKDIDIESLVLDAFGENETNPATEKQVKKDLLRIAKVENFELSRISIDSRDGDETLVYRYPVTDTVTDYLRVSVSERGNTVIDITEGSAHDVVEYGRNGDILYIDGEKVNS